MTPTSAPRGRKRAEPPPPPAQPDLAPTVQPPAEANSAAEAVQAIATIQTELASFDKVEHGLAALEQKYKAVVYAVATKGGMKEAVEARREIKGIRVEVEHARKRGKDPVLVIGRNIDHRAGAIKARLEAIENPIDQQITAQEKVERERKEAIERRLLDIRGTVIKAIGKTSVQLQEMLDALDDYDLAEFEEQRERAAGLITQAQMQLTQLHMQALQNEEAQRVIAEAKAEAERVAKITERIGWLHSAFVPTAKMARRSASIAGLIGQLEAIEITEAEFAEQAPLARAKKAEVLVELDTMLKAKQEAEKPAPTPAPTAAPTPAPTAEPIPHMEPSDKWQGRMSDREWSAQSAGDREIPEQSQVTSPTCTESQTAPVDAKSTDWLGQESGTQFRPAVSAVLAGPVGAALDVEVRAGNLATSSTPSGIDIASLIAVHYGTTTDTAIDWIETIDWLDVRAAITN